MQMTTPVEQVTDAYLFQNVAMATWIVSMVRKRIIVTHPVKRRSFSAEVKAGVCHQGYVVTVLLIVPLVTFYCNLMAIFLSDCKGHF